MAMIALYLLLKRLNHSLENLNPESFSAKIWLTLHKKHQPWT